MILRYISCQLVGLLDERKVRGMFRAFWLAMLLLLTGFVPASAAEFGVTFTRGHAKWLSGEWNGPGAGPKWLVSWEKACNEVGKGGYVRLPSHWQDVETSNGFDIEELKQALNIAQKKGVRVFVAIGAKSPRGTYVPDLYKRRVEATIRSKGTISLDEFMSQMGNALLAYNKYVVQELDKYPAVAGWQLEHEPMEFGQLISNRDVILALLRKEVAQVRAASKKPILLTAGVGMDDLESDRKARPKMVADLISLRPNYIGFAFYRAGVFGGERYDLTEGHWALLKELIQQVRKAGISPIVSGAQGEPWENDGSKVDFRTANGNGTLNPTTYRAHIQRLIGVGADAIWIDGIEFQIAASQQGNHSWLLVTRALAKQIRAAKTKQ